MRFTDYKQPSNFSAVSRHYFKKDNETGFDIQENYPSTRMHIEGDYYAEFWSNELGCFDTAYAGEQEYILLLGDSFAHMFSPFVDKWGTVMQDVLGCRLLKCGVVGYGIRQEYLKAQKILSRVHVPPRLIIVGYFINDLYEDYVFPSSTVQNGYIVPLHYIKDIKNGSVARKELPEQKKEIEQYEKKSFRKKSLLGQIKDVCLNSSALYAAIKKAGQHDFILPTDKRHSLDAERQEQQVLPPLFFLHGIAVLKEEEYPWVANAWAGHFDNLIAFKKLADDIGSQLLVVIIPTKEQVYCSSMLADNVADLTRAYKKVRDFLDGAQILYCDLLPLFTAYRRESGGRELNPEKDLYWRVDGHWSIRGNHLAGLLVADHLLQQGIIDVPDRDMKLAGIHERLSALK